MMGSFQSYSFFFLVFKKGLRYWVFHTSFKSVLFSRVYSVMGDFFFHVFFLNDTNAFIYNEI